MDQFDAHWVRLPLKGAVNVRELGGYPIAGGGQIQYRRFLRADGISELTRSDERFLYDYGVRAVIDLRGEEEATAMPDCAIGPGVAHTRIPLFEFNAIELAEIESRLDVGNLTMADIYGIMLENRPRIRACFNFVANAPAGCVLFHCSVGKDRTGILAMLLMGLAGADKWDVVANYVQSFPNLMRDGAYAADYLDTSRKRTRSGFESTPEAIARAWDIVQEGYGGVEGYLASCGVTDEEVDAVFRRLTYV